MQNLPLTFHGRLTGADDRDVLVTASAGPDGEAVALWTGATGLTALTGRRIGPGGASFPGARAGDPPAVRITVHHEPAASRVARISALPVGFPMVQPLPDGGFLVVGSRCEWRPSGPDRNALRYDAAGAKVAEHTFGDGISAVLTTGSGRTWAAYFDEGVFGNYGWGIGGEEPAGDADDDESVGGVGGEEPPADADGDQPVGGVGGEEPAGGVDGEEPVGGFRGAEPVGGSGLVRFEPDGEIGWRFPAGEAPPISDCYALNVWGEDAWVCYYTEFPVVRLTEGRPTVWHHNPAPGAHTLLTDGRRAGLVGGYRDDGDRLVLAALGDGRLHETARYRLVLPDGTPLPRDLHITARGPDLHVFHDADWYTLSLHDISSD